MADDRSRPTLPAARKSPAALSVRAQLVLGSVLVLLLMLCGFGVAVRAVASATLMVGVDNDLGHQVMIATAPHPHLHPGGGPPPGDGPPPGGGGGGDRPGGPPPSDQGNGGDGPSFFDDDGGGPPPPLNSSGRADNDGSRRRRGQVTPSGIAANPYAPRRFDRSGRPVEPGNRLMPSLDLAGLREALQGRTVYSTVLYQGQRVRVISKPDLSGPMGPGPGSGQPRGAVQASYPLGGVDRALRSVDAALLMLIPLALVGAGAGGWWITGRALHRVGRITQAAAAIGAQNLSERLPASGSDEFSELARAFNGLLGRVESAFQEQRRFTADASHELKTPLTVIQGTTSLALSLGEHAALDRSAIQEIDAAAKSMSHLVQDLLYLARADAGSAAAAGAGAQRVELLLDDPIKRAIAAVAPRSRARIAFHPPAAPVCVTASEPELSRLFLNLLENAARYTPEGGAITVTTVLDEGGKTAVATVADTGIGIAPEHLPRLTDRFYRVDDSRTRAATSAESGGSGLGLAICKSIAEAHGGSLAISSEVGVGTAVTVRLPACAGELA